MNDIKNTELEPEVIDLINAGNKIDAIKMLRELRNIGLKESKHIVDHYIDEASGSDRIVGEVESTHGGIKRSGNSNKVIFMAIAVFIVFMVYRQFS